jgi:cardiolipin synthase C
MSKAKILFRKPHRGISLLRVAVILAIGLVVNGGIAQNIRADQVRMINSETAALSQRIAMIDAAANSVDLIYYEIVDDDTAGQFFASLIRAAKRGVRVRFLCDGHLATNLMPKALMEHLIDEGICIREFPFNYRYQLELGKQRLHDKLLVVDGQQLLTGGRNLVQEYYGLGKRKRYDRDILLIGETACQAQQYFDARWNGSRTQQPSLTRNEKSKIIKRQYHPEWNDMPRCQAKLEVAAWIASCETRPLLASDTCLRLNDSASYELDCKCIRFLCDCPDTPKRATGAISAQILRELQNARGSIDIETPYFAITHRLKDILIDAERRGVRVRILTNSLESTDQVAAHAGYANQRRAFLRAGIELYEMQGCHNLHAKAMVIDGTTAMMGSYNFDVLSETRNSEVALLIESADFSKELLESIALDRSRSQRITIEDLFRLEARESDAPTKALRQFQKLRFAAPIIKPYL